MNKTKKEKHESFLEFWSMVAKAFVIAGFVCFMVLFSIGGSALFIIMTFLVFPPSLLVTIPMVLYFYYWTFGNGGKSYDAALERLENWADDKKRRLIQK